MRAVLLAAPLLALLAVASTGLTTPAACADACVVQSHSAAYVPALAEVADGGSVVWTSLDTAHVNVAGSGVGDEDSCFSATTSKLGPSKAVRFDIVDGGLQATTLDAHMTTRTCDTAVPLPDGSFVVEYYCALHPQMRAALVVTPA